MSDLERSLCVIARLSETLSDFAAREQELVRGAQSRRVASSRKFQDAADGDALAVRRSEAEAAFDAEKERAQLLFERRGARIERLRAHALRILPRQARQARENWLGDLQMRLQNAESRRAGGTKAAVAQLAGWTEKLTAQRARLVGLKKAARAALSGYLSFSRALRRETPAPAAADAPGATAELFERLRSDLDAAGERLGAFQSFAIPRIFRILPLPLLAAVSIACGVALWFHLGRGAAAIPPAGGVALLMLAAIFALHYAGKRKSAAAAAALTDSIQQANEAYDSCRHAAAVEHEQAVQRIEEEFAETHAGIAAQWERAGEVESQFSMVRQEKIHAQSARLHERAEQRLHEAAARIERECGARLSQMEDESRARQEQAGAARDAELAALTRDDRAKWESLELAWKQALAPILAEIADIEASVPFFDWSAAAVADWQPPAKFPARTRFARLRADTARLADAMPRDPRLARDIPAAFSLPLALSFPHEASLLFETKDPSGAGAAGAALNGIVLRLLAVMPPGKAAFTILDPAGLGQNFAGLMHLADYEEGLINRRIWTQPNQIEERLAELNEHIEKVIQMYLRGEYATITDYNAQAGAVAEKYHFLVVADFPSGFTETAARRLQSIAVNGPRCGVFTLLHWDRRQPLPEGVAAEELRKNSIVLRGDGAGGFALEKAAQMGGVTVALDAPPAPELAAEFIHKAGKSSVDSSRVEVPFSQIAPAPDQMWTADTTNELRVAIGRTGATKLQYLAVGKGTRQHALFAGKTGSGKSTLFHVIITNLALWCSPEQVEFYLIDFKKGVEFKCYADARLPHARVVAIESDREFALSVLQRVDEELKRRGELFRKAGAQDLAGYKRAGGGEPMPRTLLIIDEFQEFFVEDDMVAQSASLLFDRIVRQGRAFGIHVLLGSQTLGGAYTLARATLGQMAIRVALQCNEADAYLIMDENNAAPRLLSRPGEGIYNDAAGAVEGNSPFQVVWLSDEERERLLVRVLGTAVQRGAKYPPPIVFEGNAPADARGNALLGAVLKSTPGAAPAVSRCWLGAPNSIKGPTEAVFQRQSGGNLLIVGQRDEAAFTMLSLSLLALAAQHPAAAARFVFFQSAPPGSAEFALLEKIARGIPHEVEIVRGSEAAAAMGRISAELKARAAGEVREESAPAVFVFIHGLQKFKKLRHEDDFSFSMSGDDAAANPGAQFHELMTEGAALGIHLLASVDAFPSVSRFISRKTLSEWEMRVVFQMSANDSASLLDSPQAVNLGLHRAIFYNEREGTLETFRPYAAPDAAWLEEALAQIASAAGAASALRRDVVST